MSRSDLYGQGKEANGAMLTGALTSLHLMPSKALSIRSFAVGCSHGFELETLSACPVVAIVAMGSEGGHFSLESRLLLGLERRLNSGPMRMVLKDGFMDLLTLTHHHYFTQVNTFIELANLKPKHVSIKRLLKMTLEERRKEYLRGYVALKNIPTWMEDLKSEDAKDDLQGKKSLSEKVSLYRGDITLLEVDAIVNAGSMTGFEVVLLGILCVYVLLLCITIMRSIEETSLKAACTDKYLMLYDGKPPKLPGKQKHPRSRQKRNLRFSRSAGAAAACAKQKRFCFHMWSVVEGQKGRLSKAMLSRIPWHDSLVLLNVMMNGISLEVRQDIKIQAKGDKKGDSYEHNEKISEIQRQWGGVGRIEMSHPRMGLVRMGRFLPYGDFFAITLLLFWTRN
ncbi:Macrod2 [Columba livia]|nr:Macrod2 [Columba livia]